ncbi:MAG: hypothetical protein AAB736_02840 [Patescibacteria group bacterium]
MLKGLNEFNEGLVEHGLMFKSQENKESIEQAIRREISDMTRLLTETHRIDDSAKRLMTEGLVQYVMYFFMLMRKKNVKEYKDVVKSIGEYFKKMDDRYYADFDGKPEDMRLIVEFLNEIKL